jgi:uncharacterized protein (DUF433 family)
MSDVLGPFVNRNEVQIPPLLRPNDHVEVDPEIRLGHPVVVGTRVPYENVAELVADGVSMTSVKDYYPSVDADAAAEAWRFAKYVDSWRPKERRQTPAA